MTAFAQGVTFANEGGRHSGSLRSLSFRQFDRNVPCSAYYLRPSIWVSGISEVTNERFQDQKELFGKHG